MANSGEKLKRPPQRNKVPEPVIEEPTPEQIVELAPVQPRAMLDEREERVLALFQFRTTGSLEDASAAMGLDVLSIRMAMTNLMQRGMLANAVPG